MQIRKKGNIMSSVICYYLSVAVGLFCLLYKLILLLLALACTALLSAVALLLSKRPTSEKC